MNYYVKAIGKNIFAGGTDKWLKIRKIWNMGSSYEIEVRVRNKKMFIITDNKPENIKFAKGWPGLMPTSFNSVLKGINNGSN